MGISSKIASIVDELFPLSYPNDNAQFPELLENLERVLIVFPRDFKDKDVSTARNLIDVLGERIAGTLTFEQSIEFKGVKSIVLTKKDFNIAGRPKRDIFSCIADFTASIDISGKLTSPLSMLPAIAKIPLRVGSDESLANGVYNFVVVGSMENVISNLMERKDEQRRSRQKRAK